MASRPHRPTLFPYTTLFRSDVTDKDAPRFMWSIGPTQLPDLGQAWSPPAITRVAVDGATQNSQQLVLIFGGRSEEHTSELQSRENLVCRLLLEKKKQIL